MNEAMFITTLLVVLVPLAVVGAAFLYVAWTLCRPWKGPEQ